MSNITVISENNKTIIDSSELQRVTNISSSTVSAGGGSAWGSITGTLASQTDLQAELDLKLNSADAKTSSGSQYEIQYSDGAGGFSAKSNLKTDASGAIQDLNLVDSTDPTKKTIIDNSSLTTASTRTLTMPDFDYNYNDYFNSSG